MKIFQWYIRIPCRQAGFFCTVSAGGYLQGIDQHQNGLDPVFGGADPVFYPGRSAKFLVKELRRVGYNVSRRPWILYALKQRKAAKANNPWK